MLKNFLKNFDFNLNNKGEEIVISIKGEKDKLLILEKKLKAIKDLCGDEACCDCC